jgi:hypothetical protein
MRSATHFFALLFMVMAIARSTPAQAQRCIEFAEELAYANAQEADVDILEARRRAHSTFASALLSARKKALASFTGERIARFPLTGPNP